MRHDLLGQPEEQARPEHAGKVAEARQHDDRKRLEQRAQSEEGTDLRLEYEHHARGGRERGGQPERDLVDTIHVDADELRTEAVLRDSAHLLAQAAPLEEQVRDQHESDADREDRQACEGHARESQIHDIEAPIEIRVPRLWRQRDARSIHKQDREPEGEEHLVQLGLT